MILTSPRTLCQRGWFQGTWIPEGEVLSVWKCKIWSLGSCACIDHIWVVFHPLPLYPTPYPCPNIQKSVSLF